MPRGTGIIIMANSDVEVFNNLLSGNGTVNLSIVSYSDETDDPNYPHPRRIQVHNNTYGLVDLIRIFILEAGKNAF